MRQRKGISYIWPERYEDWMNGFFAGNGELGIIVFGDPLDETVIFNHRRFNIAATHDRSFSKVDEKFLKEIREACAQGDFKRANDLANQTHGWQDGGEGNRHPGYLMKIQTDKSGEVTNYVRTCDYRTGEIQVEWEDGKGKWIRSSFVSRKDNVVVQRLSGTEGKMIDCRLCVGIDPDMHLPRGMEVFKDSTPDFLCFRAVYPEAEKTNYAGYEGVTRVIARGNNVNVVVENNGIRLTGAEEVLLLTCAARYDKDCYGQWNKKLLQKKLAEIPEEYELLLKRHLELHQSVYDRVMLDLQGTEEERDKSNEELLEAQKTSDIPNAALFERLFDAGRYHYLCTAGATGVPALSSCAHSANAKKRRRSCRPTLPCSPFPSWHKQG